MEDWRLLGQRFDLQYADEVSGEQSPICGQPLGAAVKGPMARADTSEIIEEKDQPGQPHKGKVFAAIHAHLDDVPFYAGGLCAKIISEFRKKDLLQRRKVRGLESSCAKRRFAMAMLWPRLWPKASCCRLCVLLIRATGA